MQLQHEYLLLNDVSRYICFKNKALSLSIRKKHTSVTYQIITEVNIL